MQDSRRITAWILGGVAFAICGAVVAQQTTDGPFVLHEFVSENVLAGGAASPRPFGQSESDADAGSDGAPTQTERVPGQPPPLTTEATDDEPVYDSNGPVARDEVDAPHGPLNPFESPNVLDDRTDRVNSLTYFANFDPSVIPLKRVVSQNDVVTVPGGEYAVRVDPHPRRSIEVGGTAGANEQTFWGSFLLRTEGEKLHPIASVAPNQRILQLETEPRVPVEIIRDRAGNFLVKTRHEGLLRLNMQVAVDSFFFSGEFDETVQWDDFATFEDSPMIDRQVRQRARRTLRTIGVSQEISPAEAIRKMVAHYRDFEARPFPDELKGADLFESITTSKIGVCRHRSLSFVIAAHSLGIPAHYVNNEAHAFVEIGWPGRGWRRIDLGGAADELNAAADSGRSLHSPASDSLPRPERYLEEQRLMAQNGLGGDTGDSGDEQEEGGEPSGEAPDGASDGTAGDGAATGDPDGGATGQPGEAAAEFVPGQGAAGENATPAEAMTQEMQSQLLEMMAEGNSATDEPRTFEATSLDLIEAATTVRRGGSIVVVGRLTSADGPISGAPVRAYLGAPGTRSVAGAVPIGTGTTGANGTVKIQGTVPRKQATGRWSLFLVYPGSQTFAPAVAE